jgi:hypothetical protein
MLVFVYLLSFVFLGTVLGLCGVTKVVGDMDSTIKTAKGNLSFRTHIGTGCGWAYLLWEGRLVL